jgi:predicted transcriptional regulator
MVLHIVSLAERVRYLRDHHDPPLSQSELARAAGVEKSYVSALELGRIRMPANDILHSLARALGTTNADLLNAAGYLPRGEIAAITDALDDPRYNLALRKAAGLTREDVRQLVVDVINRAAEIEARDDTP